MRARQIPASNSFSVDGVTINVETHWKKSLLFVSAESRITAQIIVGRDPEHIFWRKL
jgi:hypothetical protein